MVEALDGINKKVKKLKKKVKKLKEIVDFLVEQTPKPVEIRQIGFHSDINNLHKLNEDYWEDD